MKLKFMFSNIFINKYILSYINFKYYMTIRKYDKVNILKVC